MRAHSVLLLALARVKAENGSVMQMTGGGLKGHRAQASTGTTGDLPCRTGAGRTGSPAAEGRPGDLRHIPGDRALCRSEITGADANLSRTCCCFVCAWRIISAQRHGLLKREHKVG